MFLSLWLCMILNSAFSVIFPRFRFLNGSNGRLPLGGPRPLGGTRVRPAGARAARARLAPGVSSVSSTTSEEESEDGFESSEPVLPLTSDGGWSLPDAEELSDSE